MNEGLPLGSGALVSKTGGGKAVNGEPVKDVTDASFASDVLDASRHVPVIVDLWAPWCGPCRTLGPIIEKVVMEARGDVRLGKVNIDKNPVIARQLQVQSIPAVYAFKDGKPVDGFVGALPESQVKEFIQRLVKIQSSPADALIEQAQAAQLDGDLQAAVAMFGQALKADAANLNALVGLAHCYLDIGKLESARQTLALVPPDQVEDTAVRSAQAALALKESVPSRAGSGREELEACLRSNEDDHQARYDLATCLAAVGENSQAVNHLLELIRRDRKWNDDAARRKLVTLFEALGPKDEVTIDGRRRLSSILFA